MTTWPLTSSTMFSTRSYSLLLSLYLHHPLFFIISIRFWIAASLTSHPHLPIPTPHSHYLCSLTIYNIIQGAHGLDGRPGPVVSGSSPDMAPLPFSYCSSSFSTPCYSLLDVCLSCLLAFLLLIPFLHLFWSCSLGTWLFGVGFWGFIAVTFSVYSIQI